MRNYDRTQNIVLIEIWDVRKGGRGDSKPLGKDHKQVKEEVLKYIEGFFQFKSDLGRVSMPSAMQANVGAVCAAQENMVFRLRAKTMYFWGVEK